MSEDRQGLQGAVLAKLCWSNYSGLGFWGGTAHATRDSLAKTPYFPETISCLAVIMGETGGSGHDPSWTGTGKMATFPNEFQESLVSLPRIEIRADNGRFRRVVWATKEDGLSMDQ